MGLYGRLAMVSVAAMVALSGCAVAPTLVRTPILQTAQSTSTKAVSLPDLSGAHGLETAPDGSVLIADTYGGSGGIHRLGLDGRLTRIPLDKTLEQPAGLRFDQQGRLHVTDLATGTIHRLDAKGRSTVVAKDLGGPWNLAFTRDGAMIVACADGIIWRIAGKSQRRLHLAKGENPFDVEVDAQDRIFVSLQGRHEPGEQPVRTTGRVIRLETNGRVETWADGLQIPEGLAIGPAGTLFVADTAHGSIFEVTGRQRLRTIARDLATPIHLAWRDSQLWSFLAAGQLVPVQAR